MSTTTRTLPPKESAKRHFVMSESSPDNEINPAKIPAVPILSSPCQTLDTFKIPALVSGKMGRKKGTFRFGSLDASEVIESGKITPPSRFRFGDSQSSIPNTEVGFGRSNEVPFCFRTTTPTNKVPFRFGNPNSTPRSSVGTEIPFPFGIPGKGQGLFLPVERPANTNHIHDSHAAEGVLFKSICCSTCSASVAFQPVVHVNDQRVCLSCAMRVVADGNVNLVPM